MSLVSISIGPVPAASARAWLDGARRTMSVVRSRPDLGVPPVVVAGFDRYIELWSTHVGDAEFFWSGDVDPEMLRHLAAHWARVATMARERPEVGIATAVPEGEPFFDALALGMIDALTRADDTEAFAAKFQEVVPEFLPDPKTEVISSTTSVMLVDDNDDIRLLVRIGLETAGGFEIIGECRNGQEAVDAAAACCPDAILLDLSMPVMDGLTALPLLRAKCPHARIVIFSGDDSPSARQAAEAKGASAFLRKNAAIAQIAALLSSS